jgi:hypothetical protein
MCCRACRRVRVCHTHFSIDCPTVHLCPILVQTVHCPHTHGFQFVNSSVKYVLASPPRVHDDVDLAWTTKVWRHALTNITTADVALVFSGAVLMTLVRYWLTWSVFEVRACAAVHEHAHARVCSHGYSTSHAHNVVERARTSSYLRRCILCARGCACT